MKLLGTCILFLFQIITLYSQTSIGGRVVDFMENEELIGASVKIYEDNILIDSALTDIDGNYKINIDRGTYDVEASHVGLTKYRITEVLIHTGVSINLDFDLRWEREEIIIKKYIKPVTVKNEYSINGQVAELPERILKATSLSNIETDEGQGVGIESCLKFYLNGIVNNSNCSTLIGKVALRKKVTEFYGVSVCVFKDGVLITSKATDINGEYYIQVDPGEYEIQVSHNNFVTKSKNKVKVLKRETKKTDFILKRKK